MRLDSGLSLQQVVGWQRQTIRAARLLAQLQDEPFLVSSPGAAEDQLARWREAFPTVRPAVAATADPTTLAGLTSLGVAATFTRKAELASLVELGADPSDATFASSAKLGSHLRAAREAGADTVYCDSLEELAKIVRFHPAARVLVEVAELAPDQVATILAEGRQHGLAMVGLALGLAAAGQEEDLPAVLEALAAAHRMVEAAESGGTVLTELHLGRLCSAGRALSPAYVRGVAAALAAVADMRLQADATHWLVAPTVTLAARVLAVRARKDATLPVQYYINEGVFGAFSGVLAGEAVAAPLPLGGAGARRGGAGAGRIAEILGPSGDELDCVAGELLLPGLLEGDWLLFPGMGAACLGGFGPEEGGLRLRRREGAGEGVLPVELAWAPGTLVKSISVNLGGGCGDEGYQGAGEWVEGLGELELGKTFMWADCCHP